MFVGDFCFEDFFLEQPGTTRYNIPIPMNAPIEAHLMVYLHCDPAGSTRYTGGNRSTSTLPLTRRGPPRQTGPFERPEAETKRAPVRANPGPAPPATKALIGPRGRSGAIGADSLGADEPAAVTIAKLRPEQTRRSSLRLRSRPVPGRTPHWGSSLVLPI